MLSFCNIIIIKCLKTLKCLLLFRYKLYSESSSENSCSNIQCRTQFNMLFNFNILLSNVHIIISVNSVSIIEDININLKYLYSAMLLRSISEEVKKKIVQSSFILFCSSVSFSFSVYFKVKVKV